jgi:hypothetical protein
LRMTRLTNLGGDSTMERIRALDALLQVYLLV